MRKSLTLLTLAAGLLGAASTPAESSAEPPHLITEYPCQTAMASHSFTGVRPALLRQRGPVVWSLRAAPPGMTVEPETGVPSWASPVEGSYYPELCVSNEFGADTAEFVLTVVANDLPDGEIVSTRHVDYVVPAPIAHWMRRWQPHPVIDAEYERMRHTAGLEGNWGKQIVKYAPDLGGGHSGQPIMMGAGTWNTDPLEGWHPSAGVFIHEAGHNFDGLARMWGGGDGWFGLHFHHGSVLMQPSVERRVLQGLPALGLLPEAARNLEVVLRRADAAYLERYQSYAAWVAQGGRAANFTGDPGGMGGLCWMLMTNYGPEILEKTIQAYRTDGVPDTVHHLATNDNTRMTLLFSILSAAASTDLRAFFTSNGFDLDPAFYDSVHPQVSAAMASLPDEDLPNGWKYCPLTGHYCRLTPWPMTWDAAENHARKQGGHLVTIRSQAENDWLCSRFSFYTNLWIGLNDVASEGQYEWTSGEPSAWLNWNPNDVRGGRAENVVLLNASASRQWGDAPQTWRYMGIMEAPTPAELPRSSLLEVQPEDQAVAAGADVQLSVWARGSDLVYRWYKNGAPLEDSRPYAGAGTRLLTLTQVGTPEAADYFAVVSNGLGSVTSRLARLSVSAPPPSWIRWEPPAGGNGHWYKAVPGTNGLTWTLAEQRAWAEGGYLATVTSAAENAFVFGLVNTPAFFSPINGSGPALGALQFQGATEPGGGWIWTSGESWDFAQWASGLGQPDNGGCSASQNCENRLTFFSGHPSTPAPTWNDLPAEDTNLGGFVVERDDNPARYSATDLSGLDVGAPGVPGSHALTDGLLTARGSGGGMAGTGDEYFFLHLPWAGDGQIQARLLSLTGDEAGAEAGVIMRGGLLPSASQVFLAGTTRSRAVFRRRLVAGQLGLENSVPSGRPVWLRLARVGDTFMGYSSTNGIQWDLVWFTSVRMSDTIEVGLAVASGRQGQLATAVLDQVILSGLTPLGGVWPWLAPRLFLGGEPARTPFDPAGGFKLLLGGHLGQVYRLEVSAVLPTFVPLMTVTNLHGTVLLTDSAASQQQARFYRAVRLTNTLSGLVWINPGTFRMGSPSEEAMRAGYESPHTVTLTRGFYLSQYEVTQREYLAVMGTNPCYFTSQRGYPNDLERPAETVSWSDATNYCARLTARERGAGRLPAGYAYRLPTEAEWEYACRAGTSTAFHYGSALRDGMANFDSRYEYDASAGEIPLANPTNFLGRPAPVGSYAANASGLHDMHGSLWEWCADWYGDYPGDGAVNPTGPATGVWRIMRGGAWNNHGAHCRAAVRSYAPDDRYYHVGFRPVLAPAQP